MLPVESILLCMVYLGMGPGAYKNFKAPRCRLHTFSIFGGIDIGGARYAIVIAVQSVRSTRVQLIGARRFI